MTSLPLFDKCVTCGNVMLIILIVMGITITLTILKSYLHEKSNRNIEEEHFNDQVNAINTYCIENNLCSKEKTEI